MFGIDDLMMTSADTVPYRFIRLDWPNSSGWGANVGFADIRFFVSGVLYPPGMSSNTSPSPYVASASNPYPESTYAAWRAFDGDMGTDFAQTGSGAGWIKLDFGAGHAISPDRIDLRPRNTNEAPASPITVNGSNDDVTYFALTTLTFPSWTNGVTKSFATGLTGIYV